MIKVLQSGLLTSIQDDGRFGYREFGVPISGVMDRDAATLANLIIGNEPTAAVLEMTLIGATLKFECSTKIAVTGAQMNGTLNGKVVVMNTPIKIQKDDVLRFKNATIGCRTYIAVKHGIQVPEIMKSKSYYPSISSDYKLSEGQIIPIIPDDSLLETSFSKIKTINLNKTILEVTKGPEYCFLNTTQKEQLKKGFTIGVNSRMGYQLKEEVSGLNEIITSGILPGTVQLTPSGKLIILMNDCQTTGGYSRVFQLTTTAMNILAQKKTGDLVFFNLSD